MNIGQAIQIWGRKHVHVLSTSQEVPVNEPEDFFGGGCFCDLFTNIFLFPLRARPLKFEPRYVEISRAVAATLSWKIYQAWVT